LTRATAALVLAVLTIAHHASLATAAGPKVIIVGAGMSGISAGKRLSEAGITDLVILEATDHVGGRMHKRDFGGISVEMGANWVEGVDGGEMNPIWPIVNSTLKLTNFRSDFDHLASNVYKEKGGVYKKAYVQKRINLSDKVEEGGQDDMSIRPGQTGYNVNPRHATPQRPPSQRAVGGSGHDPGLLQVRLRVRRTAARNQPAKYHPSRHLQRLRRRCVLRRRPARL
uniref:Amine oxidase domain-containing protein n=1 Tax=Aegilops tauschii subsp. strangulata TaxID=200361 RepID=A0A453JCI4_AEGTS